MTSPQSSGPSNGPTSSPPLDLLVLGGTSWLGGAIARHAAARGHRVTCLARGRAGTPPDGVTWVRSDRSAGDGYDEVRDRDWDAVVEVSWQPDFVRSALAALSGRVRHWVYVSSESVYADDTTPDQDETGPLHPAHVGTGTVDAEAYGPAKVACEEAVLAAMGADHVLVARSGLIAGYGDLSDRFGYWPARLARAADGEPVLVPPRETAVQVVDVEDQAAWLVDVAERRTAGVVNVNSTTTTFGALLDAALTAAGTRPELVEVSDAFLTEQEVTPWSGPDSLPVWLPVDEYAGFMRRSTTAAQERGLTIRPLTETVADALTWERERGLDRERRAGLTPAREAELLAQARR